MRATGDYENTRSPRCNFWGESLCLEKQVLKFFALLCLLTNKHVNPPNMLDTEEKRRYSAFSEVKKEQAM